MSEASPVPDATTITDRRPIPRGVLPRGAQAWLMTAIAVGMIGVIFFAGRPEPPKTAAPAATIAPPAPNPDRVRDYQERLRFLEARTAQEVQAPTTASGQPVPSSGYEEIRQPPSQDPLIAERKRREYESLFASNVVLSRRPEAERPDVGRTLAAATSGRRSDEAPSIDDIADAVVRATVRAGTATGTPDAAARSTTTSTSTTPSTVTPNSREPRDRTGPISATGPLHRLLEGTVIDAVLTNRLDGSVAAPVNCLVTNPVYSHSRQHVLIPAGTRVLGETQPVQSFGETRLAVAFHRLVMPDGATYSIYDFLGVNQLGDAGLRDQVNQHYWSTFGAAGAVGLISGLAQYLGAAGLGRGDGDRTLIIAGGAGDATSQASMQVMNRFLNRMPTITIREGHRVKVYLTTDLELPAFERSAPHDRF